MFRRRFHSTRRFAPRRVPFVRRSKRPFTAAKARFDWVNLFDSISQGSGQQGCPWATASPCGWSTGDCGENSPPGCCTTIITFELMSQATLQAVFQDNVTIVRLVGDLYYQESVNLAVGSQRCLSSTGQPFLDAEQYALRYANQLDWGLRKDSAVDDPQDADVVSPGDIFDRTESFWYWRRSKLWHPRLSRSFVTNEEHWPIGVCSNTSGGDLNVVPAEASGSQPTYNIDTRVSTTCSKVEQGNQELCAQQNILHFQEPPLHHWRINLRRHIRMRRDDRLHLQLQVAHPARIGWPTGFNCSETNLNEGWTSNAKIRIQALLRLS